jgi:hypothetical protein
VKVLVKQDGECYGKIGKVIGTREIELNQKKTTIYFVEFENETKFIFNADDIVCLGECK